MTRDEAIDVLELVMLQWPHYDVDPRIGDLWASVLADYPAPLVAAAAREALATAIHPPTVGQIRVLCDGWQPARVETLYGPDGAAQRLEIPETWTAGADTEPEAGQQQPRGLAAWAEATNAAMLDIRGDES